MSKVTNGAKSIVKSKTAWANSVLFVVALVNVLQDSALIPSVAMGYLFLIAAICNLVLRFFTGQSVKLK